MTTVFKGWGGAWGDSWGPVVIDPNAMYGSAALHFMAVGALTSGAVVPGELSGTAAFSILARATASVVPKPASRARSSSGYRRGEKQHGRRWRLPEPARLRSRREREIEDFITLLGR